MMPRPLSRVGLALSLALVVPSIGCEPVDAPPPPVARQAAPLLTGARAGPVAFAHQVVPTLLGRRVTNGLELSALRVVVEQAGEQGLAEALFNAPDYVDYWTRLLVDRLKASRETAGARLAQPAKCYQTSVHDDATLAAYARHIADRGKGPFDPLPSPIKTLAFTPADAIRGAVLIDDLRVMQRAYLFPMLMYEVRSDYAAGSRSRDAGEALLDVYLGRDPECLECHSSSFSQTDEWSGVDRHHPLPVDLEASLLSTTTSGTWMYGGQVGDPELQALDGIFDRGLFGAEVPWGFDADCVDNLGRAGFEKVAGGGAGADTAPFGLSAAGNVVDLEAALAAGLDKLHSPDDLSDRGEWGAAVPDETYPDETDCGGCHTGDPPEHDELMAERSDGRVLAAILRGFGSMDPQAPTYADGLSLLAKIREIRPDYIGDAPPVVDDGDEHLALAYGVAAHLSADVIEILSGSRPVLGHGQPRTAAQQALLESTTRTLIESDWSLQAVLTGWVTSDHFNRRAPENTGLAFLRFDPAFYPWVLDDESHSETNTVGDLVHRWPVANLFISAARALEWPMPRMFPDALVYPNQRTQTLMGRYTSDDAPGFADITLLSLLAWEWAGWEQCNTCAALDPDHPNPLNGDRPKWTAVADVPGDWDIGGTNCCAYDDDYDAERAQTRHVIDVYGSLDACVPKTNVDSAVPYGTASCWTDWIDRLSAQMADGTCPGLTIEDALSIVRDRMLGDPQMLDGELAAALADVSCGAGSGLVCAGEAPDTVTLDGDAAQFLRRYAHTLMSTPDFMLAGLPTVTGKPAKLPCYGCADGEPCTVDDYADVIDGWLGDAGHGGLVSGLVAWWRFPDFAADRIEFEALNRGVQRPIEETMQYVDYGAQIMTWPVPPLAYGERVATDIEIGFGLRWFAFDANPEALPDARPEDDRALGITGRGPGLPTGYGSTYAALSAAPPPFAHVEGPVVEMRMGDFDPQAWPAGGAVMGWVDDVLGPAAPPGFAQDYQMFGPQHVDLLFGPQALGVRVAWSMAPPGPPPPPPPPPPGGGPLPPPPDGGQPPPPPPDGGPA